jgi:DNA replication protein DnaC
VGIPGERERDSGMKVNPESGMKQNSFGRSRILTSQLPVSRWHEQIGDPTPADGILDRLVHNAHRIEMCGDPMRKNRGKPNA